MKWTLIINQRQAVILGLKNPTEAIILGIICDCHSWADPIIIDNDVFYWTARQEMVRQLPLLDLKIDTIYRYLKSLEKLKLIDYKKHGKKDCVRLTKLGKTYYVGKKSEMNECSISEYNPEKNGKKSDNRSEKNPIDSNISSYTSINDIEEDEAILEGELFSSAITIPTQLYGLTEDEIFRSIKELARRKQPNDPMAYETYLFKQVEANDRRTCQNILKVISELAEASKKSYSSKLDKRKLGEIRSQIATRIQMMKIHNESMSSIISDVKGLLAPHVKTYSREELEKIIREELYMAGIEGVA